MTSTMKRALDAIVSFIGLHGAVPSIRSLAHDLGCAPTNAQRLIGCLEERGAVTRLSGGVLAIGGGGVAIILPPHVARALALFCEQRGESISAVAADAITLHLDIFEGEQNLSEMIVAPN